MKLKFSVILLVFSVLHLSAQEQTLFKNAKVRGGFGGPVFSWGNIDGQLAFGAGGGGGVVLDNFFIGGFGMGEGVNLLKNGFSDNIGIGYGGLWLGYTYPSPKLAHLFVSAKLGGGAVGINFDPDHDFEPEEVDEAVFVAVPEAGLELNLTRWWRVAASVGYRKAWGFDGYQNYKSDVFDAPVYSLTVRFGHFWKRS